jgi:hypothetical protein
MDKFEANEQIARNLFDAIERVRQDVAKVEFWAGAVSGFSQPIPDYDPTRMTGWFPREQATPLKRKDS